MTRQHFELVARTIRPYTLLGGHESATADAIALDFARAFATANPRFDRERFLRACGVEPER